MKLYMHPVSITCRPVRLFAAENKIAMDEEVVDVMTGAQYKPPYVNINPNVIAHRPWTTVLLAGLIRRV